MHKGDEMKDDKKLVSEVLRKALPLPDGVTSVDFELGEDHDGDPIVRINVRVSRDLNPSKEKVSTLRTFSNQIRDHLLDKDIERWPHVRLLEA